ncbi:MAG: hypothetical protein KJ060_01905, partial [Candidatus Hydrogenedentes bacterium]|nr:hypothetical protein [Candidatus Hydrogenedentota bacterium]
MIARILFSLGLALCGSSMAFAQADSGAAHANDLPSIARNFRLNDHLDGSHELYRYRDSKA